MSYPGRFPFRIIVDTKEGKGEKKFSFDRRTGRDSRKKGKERTFPCLGRAITKQTHTITYESVRVSDTWALAEPISPTQPTLQQSTTEEGGLSVSPPSLYLFILDVFGEGTYNGWMECSLCALRVMEGTRKPRWYRKISDWIPFFPFSFVLSIISSFLSFSFLVFLLFLTYPFAMKVYHVRVEKGGKAWLIFRRHPQFYELHQKVWSKKKKIKSIYIKT